MKQTFNKLRSNAFVQGGFFFTVSNLLVGLINYFFNFLAGRALGPVGYGEIAALFSYLVILNIPIGVVGMLLIQKIGAAEDPESYTVALQKWLKIKLKRWWFMFVILLAVTPFVPRLTNLSPIAGYALPLLLVLSMLGAFYSGAIQGLHLFVWFSVLSLLGAVIKLGGSLLAIAGFGGLHSVILMIVLSTIITFVIGVIIFQKHVRRKIADVPEKMKRIRDIFKDRQLWYTAGATGILTLLNNIDIIYVKKMFSAEEAGIFGAWALFAKMILYAIGPLLTLSFIFFTSKKNEKYHHAVFIGAFLLFIIGGIGVNLGYGMFGRLMIESLFGDKFLSLYPYIEWAALFGTGYVMMMFMMNYFLAKKSFVSLVPAILFPIYLAGLFFYADQLVKVMYVDTIYTFATITIFLLVFFKNRLTYLLQLFKK